MVETNRRFYFRLDILTKISFNKNKNFYGKTKSCQIAIFVFIKKIKCVFSAEVLNFFIFWIYEFSHTI